MAKGRRLTQSKIGWKSAALIAAGAAAQYGTNKMVKYGVKKAVKYFKGNKKRSYKKTTRFIQNPSAPFSYSSFKRFRKGVPMPKYMKAITPYRHDRDTSSFVIDTGTTSTEKFGMQKASYVSWFDKSSMARPINILDDTDIPTVKGFFRQIKGDLQLANVGTLSCMITLYDCVARRDLQGTDAAADSDIPISAWDDGMAATGGNLDDEVKSSNNIGSTPFDSPEFVQKFKVLRVNKLSLVPGQTHSHSVTLRFNRIMAKEYQQAFNYYRGLTHFTLIVVRGQPCHKVTKETEMGSETHFAHISPCAVSVIKTQMLDWRGINNQQSYYQYVNHMDDTAGAYSTEWQTGRAATEIEKWEEG